MFIKVTKCQELHLRPLAVDMTFSKDLTKKGKLKCKVDKGERYAPELSRVHRR